MTSFNQSGWIRLNVFSLGPSFPFHLSKHNYYQRKTIEGFCNGDEKLVSQPGNRRTEDETGALVLKKGFTVSAHYNGAISSSVVGCSFYSKPFARASKRKWIFCRWLEPQGRHLCLFLCGHNYPKNKPPNPTLALSNCKTLMPFRNTIDNHFLFCCRLRFKVLQTDNSTGQFIEHFPNPSEF